MRVQTYLSAGEVESSEVVGSTCVVIDVIRATSTIVEALAAGARAIYPTVSTEDAIRLANSLGRDDTLLCGERKGLKIEGFDLGNSPMEFTTSIVSGKRLVMSTTNGTRAFVAANGADRVVASSFLNISAVGESVAEAEHLVLICAGKEDRFSLDDALCAGLVLRKVASGRPPDGEWELDDASRAVLALAEAYPVSREILLETEAGAALVGVGLGSDVAHCAEVDRHALVPEMHDRMIRLPS